MDNLEKIILRTLDRNVINCSNFNVQGNDLKFALKKALNNRILYNYSKSLRESLYYSINDPCIDLILKEGDRWLNRFYNTLDVLNDILGAENFIIIKTFKYYQDVTFDVDIILKDKSIPEEVKNSLANVGFGLKAINAGHAYEPISDDYLVVDIYDDFLVRTNRFADINFMLKNPRILQTHSGSFYMPNIEGELMLTISQINFQNKYITIHDFLQIINMILDEKHNINWNLVLAETSKYNWKKSFLNTLLIIKGLYYKIYGGILNIPGPMLDVKCTFPLFLSPFTVFRYDYELFRGIFFTDTFFRDLKYFQYEILCYYIRKRLPIYHDWIDLNGLSN